MKKFKKYFNQAAEIIFFIFALGIFCYSGYKIAGYYGLLDQKVSGAESCTDCSSCAGNDWRSDFCQTIKLWCQRICPCHPTSTPPPPVPTPTIMELTGTPGEPTPTSGPEGPTPTDGQTATPTPTSTPSGGVGGTSNGGGGGGGPASPCTLPEVPKTPELLSVVVTSSTEVKLTWKKVDRATHYAIAYGEASHNYTYGNSNVGNTDSYTVGGLKPGAVYYFVVSAAIGGDCPVASPYSNELSNKESTAGVLGAGVDFSIGPSSEIEGELGGGISTEAGAVAGAKAKGACPYWWIVLLAQTVILGGFYGGFLLRKTASPKFWWLPAPVLVLTAFLVDRYAHTHWYDPSRVCPWEPWLGVVLAGVETAGYRFFKKKKNNS